MHHRLLAGGGVSVQSHGGLNGSKDLGDGCCIVDFPRRLENLCGENGHDTAYSRDMQTLSDTGTSSASIWESSPGCIIADWLRHTLDQIPPGINLSRLAGILPL
jgi:hypothetical protein